MIHYIYKISHSEGYYYYGRHSTYNLNDGYMGSGKWVTSIKNKESLTKEIIEYVDSYDELLLKEQAHINEHFGKHMCMNFSKNSCGGFFASGKDHPSFGKPAVNKGKPMTKEQKNKISKKRKGTLVSKQTGEKISKSLSTNQSWIIIDNNGLSFIINDSLKNFCKNNNLRYKSMLRTNNGDRSHHKGWSCIKNVGT